jgi:hypothetical protein
VLKADCGCLAFYGKPGRIGHVAVCLDAHAMIEAGGGGPEITTIERAREQGAEVRMRPITRRRDLVALIRPTGLPWPLPAADHVTSSTLYTASYGLIDSDAGPDVSELSASELEEHLRAMKLYEDFVREASGEYGIEPAIIAAIGSRESGWGTSPLLRPRGPAGTGDWGKRSPKHSPPSRGRLPPDGLGFGRGLIQIDWDSHEFARTGHWPDPHENILYGTKVLRGKLRYIEGTGIELSQAELLRVGIAAYNAGEGNISKVLRDPNRGIPHLDTPTAHGNYSADVLTRARWFKNHEGI